MNHYKMNLFPTLALIFILTSCVPLPVVPEAAKIYNPDPKIDDSIDRDLPANELGSAPWEMEYLNSPRAYAYPGILYESRMALIGGLYPYKFSLLSAPSGMTINPDSGRIQWTPTQQGSYSVTVRATDNKLRIKDLQFPITVSTLEFYFISPNGVDDIGRDGTITRPWLTLSYAIGRGLPLDSIIVLRDGEYSGAGVSFSNSTPVILISYPGEKPVINMNRNYWWYTTNRAGLIEGIEFYGMREYCIRLGQTLGGITIVNNYFRDGDSIVVNENPGFIMAIGHGPATAAHLYTVIQNNVFRNFTPTADTTTSGAIVLFDSWKSLVEDNVVEDTKVMGLVDKDNSNKNTYRGNVITGSAQGLAILGQAGSNDIHAHHNLIYDSGVLIGLQGGTIKNTYFHHNTILNGSLSLRYGYDSAESEKNLFYYNIITFETSGRSNEVYRMNVDGSSWYGNQIMNKTIFAHNLLFSNQEHLTGDRSGANLPKYNLNQLQSRGMDLDSIDGPVGIIGIGREQGLPRTSPYFGIYGHQF